ncbi:hypothetical protein MUK42_35454 [Musa troglodytarum]|uniref:Uncharacterized protein n=1 Tax=Musa troglodytarum TaxID=320322 RepID=A0A9E7FLY5_9LILI|nr:hypothetical protein MUK42_35454 [Musa troglodytarum]
MTTSASAVGVSLPLPPGTASRFIAPTPSPLLVAPSPPIPSLLWILKVWLSVMASSGECGALDRGERRMMASPCCCAVQSARRREPVPLGKASPPEIMDRIMEIPPAMMLICSKFSTRAVPHDPETSLACSLGVWPDVMKLDEDCCCSLTESRNGAALERSKDGHQEMLKGARAWITKPRKDQSLGTRANFSSSTRAHPSRSNVPLKGGMPIRLPAFATGTQLSMLIWIDHCPALHQETMEVAAGFDQALHACWGQFMSCRRRVLSIRPLQRFRGAHLLPPLACFHAISPPPPSLSLASPPSAPPPPQPQNH